MFMELVVRPLPYHQFDGEIFIERVSKDKYIQTCIAHTNFSEEVVINREIKNGN